MHSSASASSARASQCASLCDRASWLGLGLGLRLRFGGWGWGYEGGGEGGGEGGEEGGEEGGGEGTLSSSSIC